MTEPCQYCGKGIQYEPIPEFPNLKPNVCDPCAVIQAEARRAEVLALRLARWKEMCPAMLQETNPAQFPKAYLVLNWPYGHKGMLIHGQTRRGKTRLAWLLVKRLMVDEGRSVAALTSGEFARQCAAAHYAGADTAWDWFKAMVRPDVLFIDDLGKFKLTERVEADLWEVLDHRFSNGKPVIITTNFVGKDLLDRMTPDRGEPFVARLREFCEVVSL